MNKNIVNSVHCMQWVGTLGLWSGRRCGCCIIMNIVSITRITVQEVVCKLNTDVNPFLWPSWIGPVCCFVWQVKYWDLVNNSSERVSDSLLIAIWYTIVGGIATHILKCSNFANLYLKNTNKTGTSGWTSEGKGFMLSSNKTNYSGHLCEDNAIYLKTIRSELTEIQPIHSHFGNKININTFSVKKYPHKEML